MKKVASLDVVDEYLVFVFGLMAGNDASK